MKTLVSILIFCIGFSVNSQVFRAIKSANKNITNSVKSANKNITSKESKYYRVVEKGMIDYYSKEEINPSEEEVLRIRNAFSSARIEYSGSLLSRKVSTKSALKLYPLKSSEVSTIISKSKNNNNIDFTQIKSTTLKKMMDNEAVLNEEINKKFIYRFNDWQTKEIKDDVGFAKYKKIVFNLSPTTVNPEVHLNDTFVGHVSKYPNGMTIPADEDFILKLVDKNKTLFYSMINAKKSVAARRVKRPSSTSPFTTNVSKIKLPCSIDERNPIKVSCNFQ